MKMKTWIVKTGNSYAFHIPAAFINTEVLDPKKTYSIEIKEAKHSLRGKQKQTKLL